MVESDSVQISLKRGVRRDLSKLVGGTSSSSHGVKKRYLHADACVRIASRASKHSSLRSSHASGRGR